MNSFILSQKNISNLCNKKNQFKYSHKKRKEHARTENDFQAVLQPLSIVMTMVPTLLRQVRGSLHIKKIITNAPRVLQFSEQPKYISQKQFKKVGWQDTSEAARKAPEVVQKNEQ